MPPSETTPESSKKDPMDFSGAVVEPKPAATIILIRDGDQGIEVLLLRKASGEHFAGGAVVFPGGKVSPEDEAYSGGIGEDRDEFSTLKIAAIRETHEECGIVLARRPGGIGLMTAEEAAACQAAAPEIPFLELAAAAPFEPAADQLVRFAHWVTPPGRPKRFDTHFFLAAGPADQMFAEVDGYEIVKARWKRPADVFDAMHAGELKLVLPTMLNLQKLTNWPTAEAALAAARTANVVRVMPKRIETDDGPQLVIPEEAGYGVTTIPRTYLRSA